MPLDHGCSGCQVAQGVVPKVAQPKELPSCPCGSMEERLTTDQAVAGSSPATDALFLVAPAKVQPPGVEPGPLAWRARILTVRPRLPRRLAPCFLLLLLLLSASWLSGLVA